MAENDGELRARFMALAASSSGSLVFEVLKNADLSAQLGVKLGRSPNPIYKFTVRKSDGSTFVSIAYSLQLNGQGRPATRAEAFARAIAVGRKQLFELNPFLLVFDYTGHRFLAVSGAKLFGAFSEKVASENLPVSETASFSLSPNFQNSTINMYANLGPPDVWASKVSNADPSADVLKTQLEKIQSETKSASGRYAEIVSAIENRLSDEPTGSDASSNVGAPAILAILETTEQDELGDESIRVAPRVWKMLLTAIRSSPAVILVGPPGTGKTALLRRAIREVSEGMSTGRPMWATPDESWTSRELVGGETVRTGEIVFQPGWVLRAIEENRWLVLDEANRADMDRIFGSLLTWLSGGSVSLGKSSTLPDADAIELGWSKAGTGRVVADVSGGKRKEIKYLAGSDWRLLGTYNALDAQRVFRFGSALGRRFLRVPIPAIDPATFTEVLNEKLGELSEPAQAAIAGLYQAHFQSDATRLGPALFLAMGNYLRASGTKPAGPEAPAALPDAAIAEAYLVHVGTWIANLEPDDRKELAERISALKVLTEEDWQWIVAMSASLV